MDALPLATLSTPIVNTKPENKPVWLRLDTVKYGHARTSLAGSGVPGEAVWTAVSLGAIAAWKYRDAILRKLPKRNIIVPLTGVESDELVGSLTVALTHHATSRSNATATATVSKNVQLLWNVEAPIPSLARRLEELAAWYLHVS